MVALHLKFQMVMYIKNAVKNEHELPILDLSLVFERNNETFNIILSSKINVSTFDLHCLDYDF